MTTDREFINVAAKGLKIEPEPLAPLAERFNMSIDDVVQRLQKLIDEGKVRRFAASVRHQPMGYSFNAMVIARTDEQSLEDVGQQAKTIDAVSHCYQRSHPDGDPFCIYIMMHGRDKETIDTAVTRIKQIPNVRGIEICHSVAELKKTSVSQVTATLD